MLGQFRVAGEGIGRVGGGSGGPGGTHRLRQGRHGSEAGKQGEEDTLVPTAPQAQGMGPGLAGTVSTQAFYAGRTEDFRVHNYGIDADA